MTAQQIENLAKHFFKEVADAAASDGEVSANGATVLWNSSASQRARFLGYAEVIAQMFPDCIAPYLDNAPF
jgi:hypothetical protein